MNPQMTVGGGLGIGLIVPYVKRSFGWAGHSKIDIQIPIIQIKLTIRVSLIAPNAPFMYRSTWQANVLTFRLT